MLTQGAQLNSRFWWVLAIRGLAAVLFGLIALFLPGIALLTIVLLFGAYALIDGITAIIVAIQERGVFSRWWVLLLEGIIGVIIGVMTFFWPGITALILLYLIASWAVITGVMEVAAAFMIRNSLAQEWALAIAGILSIIFGIILFVRPGTGILAIIWLVGVYAIIFGVLLIVRAFQLRSRGTASSIGA